MRLQKLNDKDFTENMNDDPSKGLQFNITYKIKNNYTLQELNEFQKETNTMIVDYIAFLCKELFPSTKVEYTREAKNIVSVAKAKTGANKNTERKLNRSLMYKLMSDVVFQSKTWTLPENFHQPLFPPNVGQKFIDFEQGNNIKTIITMPAIAGERNNNPTYLITVGANNMVDMTNNNNNYAEYNNSQEYTAAGFFQRFKPVNVNEHTYSTPILLKLNYPTVLDNDETTDKKTKKESIGILSLKF